MPAQPTVDLSMLTNRAALLNYAFKQINGVQVTLNSGSQAQNGDYGTFFQFTNTVKTVPALTATLSSWWVGMPIVNTQDYVGFSVNFWNTNGINQVYDGDPNSYVLFTAVNGGYPVQSIFGYWTLPTNSTSVQLQLASTIPIKVPGVVDARLVVRDQYGNPTGIWVTSQNGEINFPTDYAGNGELVLTTEYQDSDGNWYFNQQGHSLTNNTPMPITWVDFQAIIGSSQDVKPFQDSTNMSVTIFDYDDGLQDYGNLPLLMPSFTSFTKNVSISVYTLGGQYATSYIIENLATHVKTTVNVPVGAISVQVNFPAGDYSVIPVGIHLVASSDDGAKG